MLERPSMCYIFEKHAIQGYQICKYKNTNCLRDPTCAIFSKNWGFKDINYDHDIMISSYYIVKHNFGASRGPLNAIFQLVWRLFILLSFTLSPPRWPQPLLSSTNQLGPPRPDFGRKMAMPCWILSDDDDVIISETSSHALSWSLTCQSPELDGWRQPRWIGEGWWW